MIGNVLEVLVFQAFRPFTLGFAVELRQHSFGKVHVGQDLRHFLFGQNFRLIMLTSAQERQCKGNQTKPNYVFTLCFHASGFFFLSVSISSTNIFL